MFSETRKQSQKGWEHSVNFAGGVDLGFLTNFFVKMILPLSFLGFILVLLILCVCTFPLQKDLYSGGEKEVETKA